MSTAASNSQENGDHVSFSLTESETAPWYNVPSKPLVGVEHPFIIKDISKAIESLGNSVNVEKLVRRETMGEHSAELLLHPDDRMSKPILSGNTRTSDVLLQIVVPKRTGRKRKKDSDGQFHSWESSRGLQTPPETNPRDIRRVLRILKDTHGKHLIHPLGILEHTHRFRNMPDFAFSTAGNTFVQKVRDQILPFRYDKLKEFKLDMRKGVRPYTELIPPPAFTHLNLPFNYTYRQNPSVKQVVDTLGNMKTVNEQASHRIWTQRVAFDCEAVPTGPVGDIPDMESLEPLIVRAINELKARLEERPIWTRRALSNQIRDKEAQANWSNIGKHVYQYIGYMFRSGPWRDSVVRFGVDPRTDPKYRVYQTMMFQIDDQVAPMRLRNKGNQGNGRGGNRRRKHIMDGDPLGSKSHIFDGIKVGKDAKVWQVIDITDTLLHQILATDNLRKRCHIKNDGWYQNGTWAKAKVITKFKISHILAGRGIPNDSDYLHLAQMPDILGTALQRPQVVNKSLTPQQLSSATHVRTMASSPERPLNEEHDSSRDSIEDEPLSESDMQGLDGDGENNETPDLRVAKAMSELEVAARGTPWGTTKPGDSDDELDTESDDEDSQTSGGDEEDEDEDESQNDSQDESQGESQDESQAEGEDEGQDGEDDEGDEESENEGWTTRM